ncbi:MAG: hypothetical protein AAFX03_00345 [Pseudomonadota bacterium]
MLRRIGLAALVLVIAALAAMVWQHSKYASIRRDMVQDRQALFHGAVFHVVTFLQTAPGEDVIDAVRAFKQDTEGVQGAKWIYAGKAAIDAITSSQLPPVDWSAVVLLQYPSRAAYEAHAASAEYQAALEAFETSYSHGARRSAGVNLMLPQALLARRVLRAVTFQSADYPFTPAPASDALPRLADIASALQANAELGADAIAIVNLIKHGTPEQQAADRVYVGRMMDLMADKGYGPVHLGAAETLPGGRDYDDFAIVYYPGVDYFFEMVSSTYMQGIAGDKQLSDTQATITAPILDLL